MIPSLLLGLEVLLQIGKLSLHLYLKWSIDSFVTAWTSWILILFDYFYWAFPLILMLKLSYIWLTETARDILPKSCSIYFLLTHKEVYSLAMVSLPRHRVSCFWRSTGLYITALRGVCLCETQGKITFYSLHRVHCWGIHFSLGSHKCSK